VTIDDTVAAGTARLGSADAGELLTLQLAAWVREARENDTLDIPPLQEGLDDVVAQLADPGLTVWGYRESGRLIGTVRTSLLSPSVAFLGRLGVVPDRFRTGIGGALLRLAESRLAASVGRIELITGLRSVSNHAFYARNGYEPVDRDEARGIVRFAKDR
jgi:GNAT superfamily N-acetyltransferase